MAAAPAARAVRLFIFFSPSIVDSILSRAALSTNWLVQFMTGTGPAQNSPIGDAIDRGKWSGFQISVLVLVSLAFVIEGLTNQLTSLSIPSLMKAWNLPREPFALPLAVGLIGVAAGNAAGGWIGDRIGRRGGIIWPIVLIGVMDLTTALASSVPVLSFVR